MQYLLYYYCKIDDVARKHVCNELPAECYCNFSINHTNCTNILCSLLEYLKEVMATATFHNRIHPAYPLTIRCGVYLTIHR